jgi:hypothetical protein
MIWVVVLYGCEAWSLTLKEKQAVVLKNRVLRRIFGPKRAEIMWEWRRLYDLYCTQNLFEWSNQEE